MHRWIAFLFALALGVAPPLIGQARDSLSLDVTVGPNSGAGGRRPYYNSGGISGEVTLAFRAHPARTLAHVEAISLGRRTAMEFGDPCRIVPIKFPSPLMNYFQSYLCLSLYLLSP